MTFEQFDKFQAELLEEVVKMNNTKGKEYANGEDRFGNFNRLSAELGISPAQIGWVYLTKHLDSLRQYIRTGKTHSEESPYGRFLDAIVYLTLIAGMCKEHNVEEHEKEARKAVVRLKCRYCGLECDYGVEVNSHCYVSNSNHDWIKVTQKAATND